VLPFCSISVKAFFAHRHTSQVGDFETVDARVRGRAAALTEAKGYVYAEGFDRVVLPGEAASAVSCARSREFGGPLEIGA